MKSTKIENRRKKVKNSTSGDISEETRNTHLKEESTPILTAALFTIAKIWKQPNCPLVEA